VFFDETLGYWQVTRYEDIATAARNTKAFSSEGFFSTVHIFEENRDLIPKGLAIWTPALVNADPPAHTEVRKASDPAFRKSRISTLEDSIRAQANELIDKFVDDGQTELVENFSVPLPLITIAHILGLPADGYNMTEMRRYSDELVASVNPHMTQDEQRELFQHYGGFYQYCEDAINHARNNPGDTVLSDLVTAAATVHGEEISEQVLVGVVATLIFGGNETTRNMITTAIMCLLRNPTDHRGRGTWWCDDPGRIAGATVLGGRQPGPGGVRQPRSIPAESAKRRQASRIWPRCAFLSGSTAGALGADSRDSGAAVAPSESSVGP
jgi:cytochrome P450